jgi:hydrophobic/amphiphilic exporter-1 (mainly G- bacteria), HAE1 family
MHPIEAFVRNPVKVWVGVLMVLLFGLIAWFRMPMQLTPEVQIPTITIETMWPGASPQEVEKEIVQEQEEQLKGVEGITKMTSESTDSVGRVILEFAVGSDMQETLLRVNSRLQQVREYPVDADQPVITTSSSSDSPIAWFVMGARLPDREVFEQFAAKHPSRKAEIDELLAVRNQGVMELKLRRLAKQHPEMKELLPPDIDIPQWRKFTENVIEARFERVDGVSNANVIGGVEPERCRSRTRTFRVATFGKESAAGSSARSTSSVALNKSRINCSPPSEAPRSISATSPSSARRSKNPMAS